MYHGYVGETQTWKRFSINQEADRETLWDLRTTVMDNSDSVFNMDIDMCVLPETVSGDQAA